MDQRRGDGRRLPSLTGMRFIAAFILFAFHVIYEAPFASASFGGNTRACSAKAAGPAWPSSSY